jgi:hypothetical protein
MDAQRELDQANIDAREGRPEYARQRLWALLAKVGLPKELRAYAFVILADTYLTQAEKRACYSEALVLLPGHVEALRGLGQVALPPPPNKKPAIAPPPPPSHRPDLVDFFPVVGILDGPEGIGSAFFISRDGLLATTRHVVGGCETVTVELAEGRRVKGTIVWSSPSLDLALIETPYTVHSLMTLTSPAPMPDQPLTVHSYRQDLLYTKLRQTVRTISEGWFPTDLTGLWDEGGGPILNRDNAVVGMVTRNCSRSTPHVYALSLSIILEAAKRYQAQVTEGLPRRYCSACGQRSWRDAAQTVCLHCGTSFSEDWMRR